MSALLLPALLSLLAALPQAADPHTAAAAERSVLQAYESCHFDDGLQVVQVDALPPGVQERSINTSGGPKQIKMAAGRRVMLAYATGSFVANIKPELLPADLWRAEKHSLLDELNFLLASDHGNVPESGLPAQLDGLELHGFDRGSLSGSVLGFYMLFDDARHIATSVYLLNQDPLTRSFQTIEQYHALRNRLLTGYAACIAQNQALRSEAGRR
jgi:hypothetical protein